MGVNVLGKAERVLGRGGCSVPPPILKAKFGPQREQGEDVARAGLNTFSAFLVSSHSPDLRSKMGITLTIGRLRKCLIT